MNNFESGAFVGFIFGIVISLVFFLARTDYVQTSCEKTLQQENKPRNIVCETKIRALVVDKALEENK